LPSFLKILRYVLPYKFLLIIAGLLSLLFSLSNSLTIYSIVPIFDTLTSSENTSISIISVSEKDKKIIHNKNKKLIDHVKLFQVRIKQKLNLYFHGKSREKILITISLAIIPLIFIRAFFDFFARLLFSYAGNKAVFKIRNDIFSHLIRLPYQYFHKSRSGELISRITSDVIPLSTSLSTDIYNLFSGIILLVTNIIILSILNWKMVILIIIIMPVIAVPISSFGNLVKRYTKTIQESFADLTSHLSETFSGIKVIKSFSMEDRENSRFDIINNSIFSKELRKRLYQNLNPAIVELLGSIAAVALFFYGGYEIIQGHISSGEFIFFILIVLNLFDPLKNISDAINGTKAGEAAAGRIFKILEYPEENFQHGIKGDFNRVIEFSGVSFKYANENILKNINITIEKNKIIGIVGRSGSGKTTIINMIASLYFPSEGKLSCDGIEYSGLSLDWIRNKIAIVTQDVFLFHGTVLENLTCGRLINMDIVAQAAKTAHAHEFISKLPQGYNTIVGEKGSLLSGGERQRISIARAILSNPEIILFDEATSALDAESEKLVHDALNYLFRKTSVIISHRLSTIRHADIIYLIEKGEIADSGTHEELIERSKSYRNLFESI
jgi:ABC-type multidrug transport system fused ATPase/permease subunit